MVYSLTKAEIFLMYVYNPGTRLGLIEALTNAMNKLSPNNADKRHFIALIERMTAMSDEAFVVQKLNELTIDDI